jgi:hypothetical protein
MTWASPLGDLDRAFRAVRRRQAGVMLLALGHDPVAHDLPVAFFVVAEQGRREIVAAAVALAAPGVDLHSRLDIPLCA